MSSMPRIQDVLLPILRDAQLKVVDDDDLIQDVTINTWVPDIDYREFPLVQVRRIGGFRHKRRFDRLAFPVAEITAYTTVGLVQTEDLYEDVLDVLYTAVDRQTQTEFGYLHSIKETFGATEFSSPFQDSWRIQGLIQFGLRPPQT